MKTSMLVRRKDTKKNIGHVMVASVTVQKKFASLTITVLVCAAAARTNCTQSGAHV